MEKQVEYLGYIIEDGHVCPSVEKLKAVEKFPKLRCRKDIHSFLGLTGYFRKFIRDYAIIARPLSDVLKGNQKFYFGPEQERAMKDLKKALTTEPVLRIYRPDAITELHTDASKIGYGGALLQRNTVDEDFHPVYYMSRKSSDAEKKLYSYELELLAIVNAFKKFRVYLQGLKFKLVTDCEAFKKTLHTQDITAKIARWALLLEEFDYEVEHRPGQRLKHVDALSRYPIMTVDDKVTLMIQQQQDTEEKLRVIKQILEKQQYEDYLVEHGILMKKVGDRSLIVLPSKMHDDIIRKAHENGHFGVKKMSESINEEFYIPKLKDKSENFVSCCLPCILAEKKKGKKEGELMPILKGNIPLVTYHVNHLGPMTATLKL